MGLAYRSQLIPKTRRQRPGYAMKPASITVHNTADAGATAAAEAKYFGSRNLSASAHIFVDDKEAVLCIPLTEQAWHTGTHAGNTTSIGIEVCEFGADAAKTRAAAANAQRLIADMLTGASPAAFRTTGLGLSDVRTHQSWMQYGTSGKYCPHLILPWWGEFKTGIEKLMGSKPTASRAKIAPKPMPLLRRRSKGGAVKTLQAALNSHGAKLHVDGDFGPATLTAVEVFQHAHKLTVDGVIGPKTWKALGR